MFEKIQRVRLPFDRRSKDPSMNYGIHGLDVWFILKGPKGATQFQFTVSVGLPHLENKFQADGDIGRFSGYDVGYHALEPQYEGQTGRDCDLFPGQQCYCDGSSLYAVEKCREFFTITGKAIDPYIWKFLEREYTDRFGDLPPTITQTKPGELE